MLFSPQIPLPLEPKRPQRLDQFVAGPNASVVSSLQQLLNEPHGRAFLSGPRGSGKSHLLTALCQEMRDCGRVAIYLSMNSAPDTADSRLEGLHNVDLVCIDDLDRICGQSSWERALFRCFNDLQAAGKRMVVASEFPLSGLKFNLPDLQSRMSWGLRLKLEPVGDPEKLEILRQRSAALGIELPEDVKRYLIRHSRRDMASLLTAVDRLEQAAVVSKRRITVPLAREVIQSSQ